MDSIYWQSQINKAAEVEKSHTGWEDWNSKDSKIRSKFWKQDSPGRQQMRILVLILPQYLNSSSQYIHQTTSGHVWEVSEIWNAQNYSEVWNIVCKTNTAGVTNSDAYSQGGARNTKNEPDPRTAVFQPVYYNQDSSYEETRGDGRNLRAGKLVTQTKRKLQ